MPARIRSPAATAAGAAAPLFAALADPARLRLVGRLCRRGPQSIAQLTEGAGISRQAVTKHLRALAGAGLAHSRRRGRERIWQLQTQRLGTARHYLEQISQQWDQALDRLEAFVE